MAMDEEKWVREWGESVCQRVEGQTTNDPTTLARHLVELAKVVRLILARRRVG